MGDRLTIYRKMVGARIRGDLQYRLSFVLFCIGQAGVSFLDFLAIAVIFGQVDDLAGWSLAEVAFLYGTTGVAFNLADVFISEVEFLPERIRTGTFDRLLLRPVSPLLQLVAEEFGALCRAAKLVQSLAVLVVSVTLVDVDWTVGRVVAIPALIVSGTVIFGSMWVIASTLAFWTTEGTETANAFTYGGNFMTQYPFGIYGRWFRRLLGFVIPLAFVNYFPSLYVLDRPDTLGAPAVTRFLSPLVALAMVGAAALAWRRGLRRYASTGS